MIENIFQLKWVVSRHQHAPLLKEREEFLAHCHQQGTSHKALHNIAPELIAVIRLLRMDELREISLEEIKQAAKVWGAEQRSDPKARSYGKSARYFVYVAKKWLRFHGKLRMQWSASPWYASCFQYLNRTGQDNPFRAAAVTRQIGQNQ